MVRGNVYILLYYFLLMVCDTKELKRNEGELNQALAGISGNKFEKPDFDPRGAFSGKGILKIKKMRGM